MKVVSPSETLLPICQTTRWRRYVPRRTQFRSDEIVNLLTLKTNVKTGLTFSVGLYLRAGTF
jgi:hypothetical protein